jgi:hypothetical protein
MFFKINKNNILFYFPIFLNNPVEVDIKQFILRILAIHNTTKTK